jgi:hypothetical protein
MTPVRCLTGRSRPGGSCKGELIGCLGGNEFHRRALHRLGNPFPVAVSAECGKASERGGMGDAGAIGSLCLNGSGVAFERR